ncbi:MAG: hypothetical protein JSS32_01230 [Verrucomicrobia bacterium]|nr:hypothetical protein [Verrucomicrobiota bacterium]
MIYISGNSFMHILGIHWDQPHFRAAHVRSNRQGAEVICMNDVKQLYNTNFRGKIATGLSGKDLLIKNLSLKIGNHRHLDLEDALRFRSETSSYLPISEVLAVSVLYENKKNHTTDVTFITALREIIRTHLQLYSTLDITPDRVSAVPHALLRYTLWKNPDLKHAFVVDLGSSEWTCIWIENGRLKKSFSFSGGIEELLGALWEDRKKVLLQKEVEGVGKQIDLLQLKSHLNPHLSEKLQEKRKEVAKAIFSFARQTEPCPVLFTGRTDSFVHIQEYLIESFQEVISDERKISPPIEEHKYAISIGLALEETIPDRQSVQFLRDEFFPRKNWIKAGLFSLFLFTISMLCSGSMLFWNQYSSQRREQQISSSIEQLLNRHDPSLKREIFHESSDPQQIIEKWVSAIEKNNKDDPILLPPPRVSDVLHWIAHHPLLATFKGLGDPFEWDEIKFHLISAPKIGSGEKTYKAQVELEFSMKNAINARKFHEALLKGDDLVDPKEKIGWEVLPNGYKATFILKQRNRDVS